MAVTVAEIIIPQDEILRLMHILIDWPRDKWPEHFVLYAEPTAVHYHEWGSHPIQLVDAVEQPEGSAVDRVQRRMEALSKEMTPLAEQIAELQEVYSQLEEEYTDLLADQVALEELGDALEEGVTND